MTEKNTSPANKTIPKKPVSKVTIKKKIVREMVLPVIPIREGVLFPHTESVLTFGRSESVDAIKHSKFSKDLVVLVTQKDPRVESPEPSQLYTVGTLAKVERILNADGQINALVRGIQRIRIENFVQLKPFRIAKVEKLPDILQKDNETKALLVHLQKIFRKSVNLGKPVEFLNFMKLMGGANEGELVDQVASTLTLETEQKQEILEIIAIKKRLQIVINHLSKEIQVLEIEKDVANKTQAEFEKHMKESVLRERMRTIQKELGEIDDDQEVLTDYQKKLKTLKIDSKLKKKIKTEIKRLRQMSPNNPETGYIRSWLDIVFDLPWNKTSKDEIDLAKAEKILDQNHYGLSEVKDRILEYIAVMQLKKKHLSAQAGQDAKDQTIPTILCFVGPPGVGKTSIGRAIAEAMNRKFVKVSLGGVRDEAEIRGHRKTYVGAMPGRIINGLRQAETKNPIFMLDEVDKLGADFKGDPSAALLEALDPEQNREFEDHYLDLPFDLSQVIFITTANTLDTIPSALRDRLEIIRYPGYTMDEKFKIGKKHLLKKTIKANGLSEDQISIPDTIIKKIIENYTREAGVRSLEKNLSQIARKTAREILENKVKNIKITTAKLKKYLGPEKFDVTLAEEENQIGLATGLAWTSVGGDVLFIEVALTPKGKGRIKLTGKLGDVMKESAQAALTYVKANADKFKIDPAMINDHDIHLHVPEGAVPKDGPSAGITITTALVSAFSKRKVKRNIAMTGEVTLRGRVLRIGGLKEKSIAGHRAGCRTLIIPKGNQRDLVDIPKSVKKDIKFIPVESVDQVIKLALEN